MTMLIMAILIGGLLNSLVFQKEESEFINKNELAITIETVSEPDHNPITLVSNEAFITENPPYYGEFGSCKSIAGRTVIVSVFADDMTSNWNFQNDEDLYRYTDIFWRVQYAAEWLEEQTAVWGKEAVIISNWLDNPYLYYEADFSTSYTPENPDYEVYRNYIDSSINSQFILNLYQADNIVYMFHFNVDSSSPAAAYAITTYEEIQENAYLYEMVICKSKTDLPAAAYAHELMHTFGVPDMYYENNFITAGYIDYLGENGTTEIMYYNPFDVKEDIPRVFTELDAYYLGLVDYSYDHDYFSLGDSLYFRE